MDFLYNLLSSSNVQATITAVILQVLVLAVPQLEPYREALTGILGVLYALVLSLFTVRDMAALKATSMTYAQAQAVGRVKAEKHVPAMQAGFER